MNLQPDKSEVHNYKNSYDDPYSIRNMNDECCAKSREITQIVKAKLTDMARQESNENMSDFDALKNAIELTKLGREGFAFYLNEAFKDKPEAEHIVDYLIGCNRGQLAAFRKELEDILQRKDSIKI
ncbi:MAG: hypothetical protein H0V82_12190 [Candidatus Protochlamydia sp.]|nr:hypothetical protein [Candidatus Protochlamydia sp.]